MSYDQVLCHSCHGSGKLKCHACTAGWVGSPADIMSVCLVCKGTRYYTCSTCNGKGKVERWVESEMPSEPKKEFDHTSSDQYGIRGTWKSSGAGFLALLPISNTITFSGAGPQYSFRLILSGPPQQTITGNAIVEGKTIKLTHDNPLGNLFAFSRELKIEGDTLKGGGQVWRRV